jgi:hypothetical protein
MDRATPVTTQIALYGLHPPTRLEILPPLNLSKWYFEANFSPPCDSLRLQAYSLMV